MSFIWQISIALVAIAFTGLVFFLIKTLRAAERSLNKTSQTLQEVQKTIDELGQEMKQVLKQTSGITEDVQHKMKQIDPVLESVKNVGDVLSEVSLAAKQVSTTIIDRFKKSAEHSKASAQVRTEAATAQSTEQTPAEKSADAPEAVSVAGQGAKGNALKWIDIAAGLWQKYRS